MREIFYTNNNFRNVTLAKHFHEDYTISLVYEGKHLFSNERDKFKIVPGIIQVVNPYEIHTTNNSSWSHINIMFTLDFINNLTSEILKKGVDETILFDSYIDDEYASYLFISMFETFNSKENDKMAVENAIFEFLDYLLKNHSSIKKNHFVSQKLNNKDFSSTIDYIDANITQINISLDELSQNAGFSKFHFSREFKRNFGVSPSQFIQIKKVNRIRKLLKTDMSLSDIAYEVGFNDQSYMIKVFKKYAGFTPSVIRKLS